MKMDKRVMFFFLGIVFGFAACALIGCSSQPPEDVQALQSVMQDPNVPLDVKGQYLNWWNAEKDEQRRESNEAYVNALNAGVAYGTASRIQPVYSAPVVPWYVTHPTPATQGYYNPWGNAGTGSAWR